MAITKIKSGGITADAVETAAIKDTNVTNAKLGTDISAAKLTAGTVATARLGTGTADATTFLRGDQSYAEAGIAWQAVSTSSTFTAVAGKAYPLNTTSNAITCTLPAAASAGDTIQFLDYNRTWATNNLTLDPNSLNFQGNTSPNPVYSTDGQSVTIVYIGATKGWIPTIDDDVTLETPQWNGTTSYLVVAGGGSGGGPRDSAGDTGSGGGGAGGLRASYGSTTGGGGSAESDLTLGTGITYTITVGAGGAAQGTGATDGNDGVDSSISGSDITDVTSTGGGAGGHSQGIPAAAGSTGGSGGGGGAYGVTAGGSAATPTQGFAGGQANASQECGGGGGGASAVGVAGQSGGTSADGGAGLAVSITGSSVTYAGGGGGGDQSGDNGAGGAGGGGEGGGTGGAGNADGAAGTDALGGGGGGCKGTIGTTSGAGGIGVVIMRMATADYNLLDSITGTYTTGADGDDTWIKWTVSGTLVT